MELWEYKKDIKKCKKDHICEYCKQTISKGSEYVFFQTGSGRWWSRHKFHLGCFRVSDFVKKERAKIAKNNRETHLKYEGMHKYPKIKKIIDKMKYAPSLLDKSAKNLSLQKIYDIVKEEY